MIFWLRQSDDLCGRVRAAGQGVGIKLYFGVSQRHSSSSPQESKIEMKTKIREELMEEMRKETDRMRLELRQEFLSQQVCAELIQPLVSPIRIYGLKRERGWIV